MMSISRLIKFVP